PHTRDPHSFPTRRSSDLIAFMTREVTGKSSSNNPTPELQGFDAVLRKSPRLKWLQIHPAGAERPIYRELRARGVKVTTASGATADRKSTRLNSSHVKISY